MAYLFLMNMFPALKGPHFYFIMAAVCAVLTCRVVRYIASCNSDIKGKSEAHVTCRNNAHTFNIHKLRLTHLEASNLSHIE